MSRRTEIIDEFDDDTDIPLPSRPLNTSGTRGAILEEIGVSSDEDKPRASRPSASSPPAFKQPQAVPPGVNMVTDRTPFKTWTCVYPIYLDAKVPYGAGRRVARSSALWWPVASDIANACGQLGLQVFLEHDKTHPRDWENPGRVRILWKRNGRPMNAKITTKKKLLEALGAGVQRTKPDLVPREPYTYAQEASTALVVAPKDKSDKGKGKGPARAPAPAPAKPAAPAGSVAERPNGRVPLPPSPAPPLPQRVSQYSPAIETGTLVETIKAGLTAQESAAAAAAAPGTPGAQAPGGAAKGKKKVIRVRA